MLLRLGTRGSTLARWQAQWVADELRRRGIDVEMVPIATTGDQRHEAVGTIGREGVFTKEIQLALLDGRIDLAVHSLKDLPTDRRRGCAWRQCPPGAAGRCPGFGRRGNARQTAPAGDDRHGQSAAPGAIAALSPRSANGRCPRQRRHASKKARQAIATRWSWPRPACGDWVWPRRSRKPCRWRSCSGGRDKGTGP